MGATSKYDLPWPEATAGLRDGWNGIKLLAQAVEAALLPPLLVTDGDGGLTWDAKVAEVPWDVTDNPDRRRGGWDSPGDKERLVIPSRPGFYLVAATVTFAGKAEPDWYDVRITTRAQGSAVGSGPSWARTRADVPNSSADETVVSLATIVRIADTSPRTGFAVRVAYAGSASPPATTAGSNKLRAYRLSAL